MISPTPGSTLSGTSATFSWGGGVGVTEYHLDVGTGGVGSKNIMSLGVGMNTSRAVAGLPVGATINVRLWSNTGTWLYNDYTYQTAGSAPTPAAMISPAPGSTISGTSATFNWGGGVGVSEYNLDIGTGGVGSKDILSLAVGTNTSRTVAGLPVGAVLNVRLWSNMGTWMYRDYTYQTLDSTIAIVVDPVPGSTLPSSVTFRWTVATGASEYYLYVGTVPGGFDVLSASTGLNLTRTVPNLPRNRSLYVRLWTRSGAIWKYSDQSYLGAP